MFEAVGEKYWTIYFDKIKSHLKENVDPFDIIHKLHPTPAVCGNPTDIAMNNIRNIENQKSSYIFWYDIEPKKIKNFLVLVNKLSDENLEISIYSKTGAYE